MLSRILNTFFVFAAFMFFSTTSSAFIVAQFGATKIVSDKVTNIIVAGRGDELGYMFQNAANTQFRKYIDLYPDRQFILITVEEKDVNLDIAKLQKWGYSQVNYIPGKLTAEALFNQFGNFTQIASIDFFTHNSAHVGMNLDGSAIRLKPNHPGWQTIKYNFLPGSFLFLHGCNSGFYMAPELSQVTGVPVLGSLAATSFQYLHEQNLFFRYDSSTPPVGKWATKNSVTYSQTLTCEKDQACIRMQSDSFPYDGLWGSFTGGGLSFFKTFCRGVTEENCMSGMVQALRAFVSVRPLNATATLQDYKEVVIDFLCPFKFSKDIRGECRRALEKGADIFYNPFEGRALQCDMNGCTFEFKCQYDGNGDPIAGSCALNNPSKKSTTLMDEYKKFVSAFKFMNSIGR